MIANVWRQGLRELLPRECESSQAVEAQPCQRLCLPAGFEEVGLSRFVVVCSAFCYIMTVEVIWDCPKA